jgi:hypothetical protein
MATKPSHALAAGDRLGDALADVRALLEWVRHPNPSLTGSALRTVDEQMLAQAEEAMDRVDGLLAEFAADENTRLLTAVDKALAAVRFTVLHEVEDADAARAIETAIEGARDEAETSL